MRWFTLAVALAALAAPLTGQATDAAREAEVRAVVEGFHADLAAGDSAIALGRLHPDVLIYESGHAESLAEYRGAHLGADIGFASATTREVTAETVNVWGDQALYMARSRTTGRYRGRDVDMEGTETMVLIRTPQGWRIRHVHWSSR